MSALLVHFTSTPAPERGIVRTFTPREAIDEFQGKRRARLDVLARIEQDMHRLRDLTENDPSADPHAAARNTELQNLALRVLADVDDLRQVA